MPLTNFFMKFVPKDASNPQYTSVALAHMASRKRVVPRPNSSSNKKNAISGLGVYLPTIWSPFFYLPPPFHHSSAKYCTWPSLSSYSVKWCTIFARLIWLEKWHISTYKVAVLRRVYKSLPSQQVHNLSVIVSLESRNKNQAMGYFAVLAAALLSSLAL